MEDLALPNEIIERPHHFVQRRDLVPDVQPVEVDVVSLKSLQTGFDRPHHVLPLVAPGIGVGPRHGVGVLGRQDGTIPVPFEELAEQ